MREASKKSAFMSGRQSCARAKVICPNRTPVSERYLPCP